ncbi:MAG: RagB/SusD family nutrient uptake outer membrane protein [Anditalea sp.]
MKNKLIYFFIMLSLLIFNNSCNDDKLDILPINILTDDQIFQSEAGIEAYMASLYDKLPLDGFNRIPILSNSTDESMSYLGNAKLTSISDGTWFPWWGYDHIRNVNDLIGKLPTANLSDSEKSSLLGEAQFIRAFYYFGLGKRYGGIPIIKEVQNFTGDNIAALQVPRNTEKEVWDFIATELDEAASALPEINVPGRATKYAALALKSRAMLYAASVAKYGSVMLNGLVGIDPAEANKYWQASYDAAKLVIDSGQHSLYMKNPDKEINFTELFLDNDNPEAIFSVYYQYPDKTHRYDQSNLPFSIRAPTGFSSGIGPYLELVEQFEYVDGTPGTLKLKNPDGSPIFYEDPTDLFLNKDPRCLATVIVPFGTFRGTVIDVQAGIYDQGVKWEAGDETSLYNLTTHQPDNENGTIRIVGVNGFGSGSVEKTQTGFYIRKYLDYNMAQSRAASSDQAWIVFRYAEVLLNYAEAAVELDKISDAKWATNEIRDRAGIKLLDDAEVTLERVRHERLVELAFESHRWWDYRRWRISDKKLNNVRFTALKPYYDVQADAYRFETAVAGRWHKTFDAKAYYERIDPGEIAKNPTLIQNPNY